MRRGGFTLVEAVVVLVILAVLAVVMTVSLQSQSLHKLNAAAERMASDIRYAQQLAISTGNFTRVATWGPGSNTDDNQYDLFWITVGDPTENLVSHPLDATQAYSVDFDDPGPHQGVTFTPPACIGGPQDDLYFDPNGIPQCCNLPNHDACAPMTEPFTIALTYGGRTRRVAVAPQTGMVGIR